MKGLLQFTALCMLLSPAHSFYIPSMGPQSFRPGDRVPLTVNRVFSEHVPLPFAYYDLPFVCRPQDIKRPWLNLGEVLRGDRIASSDYKLSMGMDTKCAVLCTKTLDAKASVEAGRFVEQEYHVEWLVDKLPSATTYLVDKKNRKEYSPGFAIGTYDKETGRKYLNNHVEMHILYEKRGGDARRIVGFEAYPRSIENDSGECPDLDSAGKSRMEVGAGRETKVTYSYSVRWIEENSVEWTHRWDRYLATSDPQIHWYSIFNSAVIILLLSGVIAVILMRMLNRDLSIPDEEEAGFREHDIEETSGWKLLHGDVFRPPDRAEVLAPLLGTTVQVLYTFIATTVLGTLGILSPSYRGGLLTTGIIMFLLMGSAAGYYSGHLYRTWRGSNWIKNALMTSALVPGSLMSLILFLNLFLWYRNSSAAIPFSTLLLLFTLWLLIELPLVLVGGWFGYKRKPYSEPARTNPIPRPMPPTPGYLRPVQSVLLAGALPFAVVFIELFFVLKSIWQDAFYYEYGFAAIVGVVLSLAVCETTIIMVWLTVNSGNHQWWWRAFAYGASSSVYIFAYSVFYYFTRMRGDVPDVVGFVPALTYFVQMLVICAAYALCTGSMGFFAAYFFVRRIYRMVKLM